MSTPTYRKKLIEVDLPLDAINRESAREKSIRHGHPSTLHLWWARRPLAACRAVIFSSMVDDPSSCPEEFPTIEDQDLERQRLHKLIERLVVWENSNNEGVLAEARREVAVSVARSRGETAPESQSEILEYLRDHAPTVYDPFCGWRIHTSGSTTIGIEGGRLRPEPGSGVDNEGDDRAATKVRQSTTCQSRCRPHGHE